MNLWNLVKGGIRPDPMAARVIHGDPLVITDENSEIVFAAKVEIEIVQSAEEQMELTVISEKGAGRQLKEAQIYLAPETIKAQTMLQYDRLQLGNRGGDAYLGVNESGAPTIWFLGSAADALILEKARYAGQTQPAETSNPPD